MTKRDIYKKNCEINNYKHLLQSICDTDFICDIDTEPASNTNAYAEYVWMKPPIKIEEEKNITKEKK
jgi:hypothetical protein